MTTTLPLIKSLGYELPTDEESFGFLRESHDAIGNFALMRERLEEDGYLYIPGYFEREDVMAVRRSLTDRLAEQGLLHPEFPSIDAITHPKIRTDFKPDLAMGNPVMQNFVFGERMLSLYRGLMEHEVLHFDYIWIRAYGTGPGTQPHCDIVYMGRGTHKLMTAWVPYGDVPLEVGGLILLEGSHKKGDRLKSYLEKDVDTYCSNKPEDAEKITAGGGWHHRGHRGYLSSNPVTLRENLGGRWLTAPEYKMGDLLTFGMGLVHGSLDNQTPRIRLSSDTRYQRSDEPADHRWIGKNPPGHSTAGKRGRIC